MFFFCCFLFFQSWISCLVSNLVSPLLDGLNDLLNNGSLLDLSDWGKGISTGFWESKTGVGNRNRGSGIGSGCSSKSYWGSSSIGSWGNSMSSISIGGSIAGIPVVCSGMYQVIGIGQLGIGSHRGNSTGKNDLRDQMSRSVYNFMFGETAYQFVHDDGCLDGLEELMVESK